MATRAESLAALTWLIEAGADEAIAETPVNRFRPSVVPAGSSPREAGAAPNPASLAPATTQATSRAAATAKVAAETVSLSTPAGAARALAAGCSNLAELRQALINFDGCGDLKRSAKNMVFADGNPEHGIMLI